jgi:hypothetical protein
LGLFWLQIGFELALIGFELALIGFVFTLPQTTKIFILSCYQRTYAKFLIFKIGFVFSNQRPAYSV